MGKSHLCSRTVWKSKLQSEVVNAKYSKAVEEFDFFHRLVGVLLIYCPVYSASALQRKVTIWARVQLLLEPNRPPPIPQVTPFFSAQVTAAA